jgi:hypothetical protein
MECSGGAACFLGIYELDGGQRVIAGHQTSGDLGDNMEKFVFLKRDGRL